MRRREAEGVLSDGERVDLLGEDAQSAVPGVPPDGERRVADGGEPRHEVLDSAFVAVEVSIINVDGAYPGCPGARHGHGLVEPRERVAVHVLARVNVGPGQAPPVHVESGVAGVNAHVGR